jgi:hypothetical protein
MEKRSIKVEISGFAREGAKQGENVELLRKERILADHPHFYMYMNQLDALFLQAAELNGDGLTHFIALIHEDETADIYTQYDNVFLEIEVKQVDQESTIYNIENVRSYGIDGIVIKPSDAVVCVMKVGWKYGLFFDFAHATTQDKVWQELGELYNTLHFDRIIENIRNRIRESEKPHIITEGKTDWRHLEAARRELEPELLLGYPTSDDTLGDTGLFQVCERLAKFGPKNKNKVIAIFDRDSTETLNKLKKYGDLDGYQLWGNNVFSFVLPVPAHRKGYKNLCIELLYSDKDLARSDGAGKRLFFDNEVKIERIPGEARRASPTAVVMSKELDKKVFGGLADRIEDEHGNKVGLSKAAFAQLIYEQSEYFKEMDFSGFRQVIQRIKQILRFDPPEDDR